MTNFERTKVDPAKITGPYQLLSLFLIVVEGLLGFWLFRAGESIERIVAGVLMTLILGGFLYVFLRMLKRNEGESVRPQGLPGNVTPAEKEVTEIEVASPEVDMMAGIDQSYIIAKPPENWKISKLTLNDWITSNMGISDSIAKKKMLGEDLGEKNILAFIAPDKYKIDFAPGQSIINNRKALTALEVELNVRMAILPMERVQPPLFIEIPFEHNFQTSLSQVAAYGIMTLRQLQSGVMKGSRRRFLLAEFRQDLENILVNNAAQKNLSINMTMIGIEGELRDHLIIMHYPSFPNTNDLKLQHQLQTLQNLVSSFKPLKVADPDAEHKKIMQLADEKFKDLFYGKGEELFFTEFAILALRIKGIDLSDPFNRQNTIRQLKPFETFAKEIGLEDEELTNLWEAMHDAEKGNAEEFKKQINDIIEEVIESMSQKSIEENSNEPGSVIDKPEHLTGNN